MARHPHLAGMLIRSDGCLHCRVGLHIPSTVVVVPLQWNISPLFRAILDATVSVTQDLCALEGSLIRYTERTLKWLTEATINKASGWISITTFTLPAELYSLVYYRGPDADPGEWVLLLLLSLPAVLTMGSHLIVLSSLFLLLHLP